MDHAPLNLGLWVDCLDRFLKAGKPVHTEKEDILYTTVFQVVEHPQPELAGLIGVERRIVIGTNSKLI